MLKLLDLLFRIMQLLNDRYIETQRQIRTWKDKYAALNKAVDDYLSSFEALKKTTD